MSMEVPLKCRDIDAIVTSKVFFDCINEIFSKFSITDQDIETAWKWSSYTEKDLEEWQKDTDKHHEDLEKYQQDKKEFSDKLTHRVFVAQEVFEKLHKQAPVSIDEYKLFSDFILSRGFLQACEEYFSDRVIWTQKQFEQYNPDTIRRYFLQQATKSVANSVLEYEENQGYQESVGVLDIYKLWGEYIVSSQGERYVLWYMQKLGSKYVSFLWREGKYVFSLDSGKLLYDDIDKHAKIYMSENMIIFPRNNSEATIHSYDNDIALLSVNRDFSIIEWDDGVIYSTSAGFVYVSIVSWSILEHTCQEKHEASGRELCSYYTFLDRVFTLKRGKFYKWKRDQEHEQSKK
jgi:predicted heme/steroid binding protein